MYRRVFIGINLPEVVKKKLAQKASKWPDLPVKWTIADNLHITLAFLGQVKDESLVDICARLRQAVSKIDFFEIELTKIRLGPNENKPRMIWASGKKSKDLKKLQEAAEESAGVFIRRKREFRPHVTLGRVQKHKWNLSETAPFFEEKINFIVPISSVEVMESVIENGQRKYLLLESCSLK